MNGFMYDEIEKNGGWNEEGKLFIPESCYECILMEDVFNSYSKCRADGKRYLYLIRNVKRTALSGKQLKLQDLCLIQIKELF